MEWREHVEVWMADRYPRCAAYDIDWMMDNMMGPNALWLMESLTNEMHLEPGMRVLDMGCGKAISSIFLAREFGVQVWATDYWIGASENLQRIKTADVEDRVFPIHAEAHFLPFANEFFDVAVSVDAYHYFGTDHLYSEYFAGFIRPGGEIGIIVPGLVQEFAKDPPAYLGGVWPAEFFDFHSPSWWREHWRRSGRIDVRLSDMIEGGWEEWLLWVGEEHEDGRVLKIDQGRNVGFTRVIGNRS